MTAPCVACKHSGYDTNQTGNYPQYRNKKSVSFAFGADLCDWRLVRIGIHGKDPVRCEPDNIRSNWDRTKK